MGTSAATSDQHHVGSLHADHGPKHEAGVISTKGLPLPAPQQVDPHLRTTIAQAERSNRSLHHCAVDSDRPVTEVMTLCRSRCAIRAWTDAAINGRKVRRRQLSETSGVQSRPVSLPGITSGLRRLIHSNASYDRRGSQPALLAFLLFVALTAPLALSWASLSSLACRSRATSACDLSLSDSVISRAARVVSSALLS